MYYDYFGLKQPPFRITPDTSLFYPGGDRGAVLDALIYAILSGEGMVKVVGEVGSGKTMLCRMLEKELPDKVEVVYLANPSLSPENILHAIAFELKLPVQTDTSRLQVMHNLQEYLLERHAENRQVVVFVEEAQAMPVATLEEIRLLSNLETQQSKLLQIVMFGQPELDELISRPEIRQLKERITYSFQLNPFVSEHIRDYVNTRLRASGYRSGEIFNKGAIRKIEHYSRGLLRRINILADKSLLAAYAGNTNEVTAKHVEQAARDSEFVTNRRRFLWLSLITTSALLIILVILAYWQITSSNAETLFGAEKQSILHSIAKSESASTDAKIEQLAPSGDIQKASGNSHNQPLSSTNKTQAPIEEAALNEIKIIKNYTAETGSYSNYEQELQLSLDDSIEQIPTGKSTTLVVTERGSTEIEISVVPAIEQSVVKSSAEVYVEAQLLDLAMLFELQDLGDSRLSNHESALLRKQLKELPPEVALYQDSSQFSDICKLCWSILYRPVTEPENL
jgi:type II secretory pathway predicted ATPase ExeA